ncbi:hypothetical protein OIU84_012840 [Salix udensis]|uniref:Uncharacterized protein n=1 Tax=Salix udensis TaxID=889485 RepID=A0AAD6JGL1_9ROSI|nr:hypothetical protein OIU84_012840 [Salix udensis]
MQQKVKQLQNDCSNYKNEADYYKEKMKYILDEAFETRKIILEHGESSGHAREAVEKQTDFLNSMSRELLKTTLPGGGTCDSTSASTDKDAYPPLELSVIAMKSDGSVTTESYEQCKSLPEEWTPLAVGGRERLIRAFFGLREHYTATTIRHAQEIAKRDHDLVRHAQEIAKRDHDLVRHAQEIAKRDHELVMYQFPHAILTLQARSWILSFH